jgi:hypothetical protein
MNLIIDTVNHYLPIKRKLTPSGWISFNAICCHHNGTGRDTRQRGGIIFQDKSVSYHCFNCQFKASWQPGRTISSKFKKLLIWLNVPDDLVNKCIIDALRLKETGQGLAYQSQLPVFLDKALPRGAMPIKKIVNEYNQELLPILEYIHNRNLYLDDYNWHWTDEEGFGNRLIIPFYYQGRLVGYTARKITDGKPKYISEQQPGYVFNLDKQYDDKKYVIVVEGPFDAISIDGVAILGSEVSEQQKHLINQLDKTVIVVPDRDSAGQRIVNQAIENNWSVSFPEWNEVKDVSDSVIKYGRLATLYKILDRIEHNSLKIQLLTKTWFKGA